MFQDSQFVAKIFLCLFVVSLCLHATEATLTMSNEISSEPARFFQPKSLFVMSKECIAIKCLQNIQHITDLYVLIPSIVLRLVLYEVLHILEDIQSLLWQRKSYPRCKIKPSVKVQKLGQNRYYYTHINCRFHSQSYHNLNADIDKVSVALYFCEEQADFRLYLETVREKRLHLLHPILNKQRELHSAFSDLYRLCVRECERRNMLGLVNE